MNNRYCAVVTTFSPDIFFKDRLKSIAQQVGLVIIVNDSGSSQSYKFKTLDNTIIIDNATNCGISFSLNVGVNEGIKRGYFHFITFDDDTFPIKEYVSTIDHFLNECNDDIGLVSLSRKHVHQIGEPISKKRTLITSGCYFSYDTYKLVNGFNEDYFIDIVDHEFSRKVSLAGKEIIEINKFGMEHSVGTAQELNILGNHIIVYNHSPFRLYYQIRNSLVFFSDYYKKDFLFSLAILSHIPRIILKAALFESNRRERLAYCSLGLKDAFIRKMGKLRN